MFLAASVSQAALHKLEYDPNGNLVAGMGKFYEYNDSNKLVRVREGSKEGTVIAEYWYDYQGQRIKKVENGITTYYIGKQYEERRGPSTNEKTNFYFAGGQRVARKTQIDTNPAETTYYFNNHLGSAEAIADANGVIIDQIEYYPYGSIRNVGKERYSYTGKEKDSATGQYYYEARYYEGLTNHFTQADTVTPNIYNPQSLNKYSYAYNNPVVYLDPSGHVPNPFKWWWKGIKECWDFAKDPTGINSMEKANTESNKMVNSTFASASRGQRLMLKSSVDKHYQGVQESIKTYISQVDESKERVIDATSTSMSAMVNLASGDLGGVAIDAASLTSQLIGANGYKVGDHMSSGLGIASTIYGIHGLTQLHSQWKVGHMITDQANFFGRNIAKTALQPIKFQSGFVQAGFEGTLVGLDAVEMIGASIPSHFNYLSGN
jgi:RHS repeat-associated protein